MKYKVLIIDDDLSMCTLLSLALKDLYDVEFFTDATEGLERLKDYSFDLVLLDLMIGQTNGINVLKKIKETIPQIQVIMMTAFGSIRTSVEAMKQGSFTYLTKPLDIEELCVHIDKALDVKKMSDEITFLSDELKGYYKQYEMVGQSKGMQEVYALIGKLKNVDTSVTVSGESGTGKELVARALHFSGKRSKEHFVIINCAAIPENLLEEELFGHKKGTFTGAISDKKGKFETANKGTVFLDEIGDLPIGLQSKLLRVLQQKEFTPLGGTTTRKIDIRIIAATNRNLSKMVECGEFREDLFYRLNVMNIKLPPLRERKDDIPYFCTHFIKQYAREQNKQIINITEEALKVLVKYSFPGNVRQLANAMEHAVILCDRDRIELSDLPQEISKAGYIQNVNYNDCVTMFSKMKLKEVEHAIIQENLKKNNGRRDITASDLGISIRSLYNKIKEYKIV